VQRPRLQPICDTLLNRRQVVHWPGQCDLVIDIQ